MPAEVAGAAERAGRQAQRETGAAIRALLVADIDEQRTTPLALLRQAVRYPTEVLRQAGVPPVERDRFAEQAFPDDDYDLSPATWADVDPGLDRARHHLGRGQGLRAQAPPLAAANGASGLSFSAVPGEASRGRRRCCSWARSVAGSSRRPETTRASKNRQPSGQAKGCSRLADSRHRCTASPTGVLRCR